MQRTYIYIDGFNLYYGSVKGTPFRWLDVARMCSMLLPKDCKIEQLKYFTAVVSGRPGDPDKPVRQETFIRALRTIPNLEVIKGHFLTHAVRLPLVYPPPSGPRFAEVWKTEEKGSDVNIACHLLNDAYLNCYDTAVLVSNDSDLAEALRIVTGQMKKQVGIINPQKGRASKTLVEHAVFVRSIRKGVLGASQFPEVLADSIGAIRKPAAW
jgi:uncharacterized LabA/DUF88 family protein